MDHETLETWLKTPNSNPSKGMNWYKDFYQQVNFVRGILSWCLTKKDGDREKTVRVISTHTSKSIVLPVYKIDVLQLKSGELAIRLILRNNFYNWNVSVESETPLSPALGVDFLGVVTDYQDYCFCEGMEQYKYGPYSLDPSKFTFAVPNDYDLYVFARVLRNLLGLGEE